MDSFLVGLLVFAAFVILVLVKTAVVVPQRSEYVVERLGKYRAAVFSRSLVPAGTGFKQRDPGGRLSGGNSHSAIQYTH